MKKRRWTKEELDFLRNNYKTMPIEKISKELDRTKKTILQKAYIIGLATPRVKEEKEEPVNLEDVKELLEWAEEHRQINMKGLLKPYITITKDVEKQLENL